MHVTSVNVERREKTQTHTRTLYCPVGLQPHLEGMYTICSIFPLPVAATIPGSSGPLSLLLPDSAPAAPTNREGGLCKQLDKLHTHN